MSAASQRSVFARAPLHRLATAYQGYSLHHVAQAMNLAMQNKTFKDVMASAGLPIDASVVVGSYMIPGPSVLQQAAEMGYPSTVYMTPHISSLQLVWTPDRLLAEALCGSIVFSGLLLGAVASHICIHMAFREMFSF